MQQPTIHVERPHNQDGIGNPDHLLIWLDKYIGKPHEYLLLKRAFLMTTDPTTGYEVNLREEDITRSITMNEPIIIRLDGIQFMLRAFDTVDACFETIENNLDKRIFFITSGTKGRIIIPALKTNFPNEVQKNYPIYLFCGNMNMVQRGDVAPAHEWAWDFTNVLLMYNIEDDLLERLVLDIADYFFEKAQHYKTNEQKKQAREHYIWSKIMYQRYEKMTKKGLTNVKIKEIDSLIDDIDEERTQQDGRGNSYGEPPY